MNEQQQKLSMAADSSDVRPFRLASWPKGKFCEVGVKVGDLMQMSSFMVARPYCMFVVDLPRGLNLDAASRVFDIGALTSNLSSFSLSFRHLLVQKSTELCVSILLRMWLLSELL